MVIKPITNRKTASVLRRIPQSLGLRDTYTVPLGCGCIHQCNLREFEPPRISVCQYTFPINLTSQYCFLRIFTAFAFSFLQKSLGKSPRWCVIWWDFKNSFLYFSFSFKMRTTVQVERTWKMLYVSIYVPVLSLILFGTSRPLAWCVFLL